MRKLILTLAGSLFLLSTLATAAYAAKCTKQYCADGKYRCRC